MRPLFLLLVLLLMVSWSPAQAGELTWTDDYSLAMEQALLTRRPLLVTFATSWCGWCRRLEGNTFTSSTFEDAVEGMILVKLDGDTERGLVSLFRVTGYPTTVMLDRTGREIGRVTGYQPPQAFAASVQAALSRREALSEATTEVEERPDDPEAAYELGDVLLALRQFAPAREAFQRVIELDPTNQSMLSDDASLDIGVSFILNREFAPAVSGLQGYLEQFPQSERRDEGLFFLGLALIGKGDVEAGMAKINEAALITRLNYIRVEAKRIASALQG